MANLEVRMNYLWGFKHRISNIADARLLRALLAFPTVISLQESHFFLPTATFAFCAHQGAPSLPRDCNMWHWTSKSSKSLQCCDLTLHVLHGSQNAGYPPIAYPQLSKIQTKVEDAFNVDLRPMPFRGALRFLHFNNSYSRLGYSVSVAWRVRTKMIKLPSWHLIRLE